MTVFAPVNSAFEKIDSAALSAVLADTDKLDMILKYHAIPSQVLASDLSD